jgi:hypothetical protein
MTRQGLKLPLLAVAGAGLLLFSTAASADKVIIVRSAGPSAKAFPPGKTIPESASILLQAGDMVTVLGSTRARTLRGPGTFSASPGEDDKLALAIGRRARFGALRASDYPQNPNPWNIDISRDGKMCVADSSNLMLWRPQALGSADLHITASDGAARTLRWPERMATLRWPAGLPVRDGAEYQLAMDGAAPVRLTFVALPGTPGDMIAAAATLIEQGCETQLNALVNGLHSSEPR